MKIEISSLNLYKIINKTRYSGKLGFPVFPSRDLYYLKGIKKDFVLYLLEHANDKDSVKRDVDLSLIQMGDFRFNKEIAPILSLIREETSYLFLKACELLPVDGSLSFEEKYKNLKFKVSLKTQQFGDHSYNHLEIEVWDPQRMMEIKKTNQRFGKTDNDYSPAIIELSHKFQLDSNL